MNKEYCEKVRFSAMAISDGEQPLVSENEINEHLSSCINCRLAIEQLHSAAKLLEGKQRKSYDVNVAQDIEAALSTSKLLPGCSEYSGYFIALCFTLFILKIIGISPALSAAGIARFLTILVVIVFFILIKQSPFTISPNIQTKGV
jgi:hypothetical protein